MQEHPIDYVIELHWTNSSVQCSLTFLQQFLYFLFSKLQTSLYHDSRKGDPYSLATHQAVCFFAVLRESCSNSVCNIGRTGNDMVHSYRGTVLH